jgi:hypothetical protein
MTPDTASIEKRDQKLEEGEIEKLALAHCDMGALGSLVAPPATPLQLTKVPGGELLKIVCSCTEQPGSFTLTRLTVILAELERFPPSVATTVST